MDESDPDAGYLGRGVDRLPEGGSLVGDLRRAFAYLQTISRRSALLGVGSTVASVLYLGIPLVTGYALAATRRCGANRPAPTFDDWRRLFTRGFWFLVVTVAGGLGLLVAFAFVAVTVGPQGDAFALLWFLSIIYLWPWSVVMYPTHTWRDLIAIEPWQWLFTADYAATALTANGLLIAGTIVTGLGLLTIVGAPVAAFATYVVIGAFLGQRYATAVATDGGSFSIPWSRIRAAVPSERIRAVARDAVGSAAATASAAGGADGPATASGSGGSGEPATADAGEEERRDYERLRERAREVDQDGPISLAEAGDGGRVGFLQLAVDDGDASAAFDVAVDRWDGISHNPTVTTVHAVGDDASWVAFDAAADRLADVGGDLPPEAVRAVVGDVATALTTGRQYNIAHGDLRPECVYVDRGGERASAAVAEWGLRREVFAAVGLEPTAAYLAPEQLGGGAADHAVDVYQIAAVAYYALCGAAPYEGVEAADVVEGDHDWTPATAELPDGTARVLGRGLAVDPDERYDSVSDFRRAFDAALS